MSRPLSFDCVLPRYSIGVGDRFGQQAKAQLRACIQAVDAGVDVIPVWNKSNREHTIIGSGPDGTRAAADSAVRELGWKKPYFVDADHIGLTTVDRYLEFCDFFTIDVADRIGKAAADSAMNRFLAKHDELLGPLHVPGVDRPLELTRDGVTQTLRKYLAAVQEAVHVFEYVAGKKGKDRFVAEVSMDETDSPQTPAELLIILIALADADVRLQTIAPKFTGRFNKGVDYEGDLKQFSTEFSDDLSVIAYAVGNYGLPANLKLSVHSGSDKFAIYSPMHQMLEKNGAGIHLKTAGTSWLEELIGLAESGGEGLEAAKEVYAGSYERRQELSAPYASVIDIGVDELPAPADVSQWSAVQFVDALRHDQSCAGYNRSFRQLLHIGFKVAAQMGPRYLALVRSAEPLIAKNITTNLFERHIKPLFLGA